MATIQTQCTLVHAESGLAVASVIQRTSQGENMNSLTLTLVGGTPTSLPTAGVTCPREVMVKLISGSKVKVSIDNGTSYPLELNGAGEGMMLTLTSGTVNKITCIADVAGNLGGKHFVVTDLFGPVWVWLDTGNGAGQLATVTITSDGTAIPAGTQVVLGSETYTFKTLKSTLTASSQPVNTNTVTISGLIMAGNRSYEFITPAGAITTAGQVSRGANTAEAMANLAAAIINDPAGSGVVYGSETLPHPDVTAISDSTSVTITANDGSASYAALLTGESSAVLAWTAATLGGGASPNSGLISEGDVFLGDDSSEALINLSRAVNHTGTPNTDYKKTAAHATIQADSFLSGLALSFDARTIGVVANAYPTTTSSTGTVLEFDTATMTGGKLPSIEPIVTTERLLPVTIVENSSATAIAIAIAAEMDLDASFDCVVPSSALLVIEDTASGPRTTIAVGDTGFTLPVDANTFDGPTLLKLLSKSGSQVVVAVAPA